MTLQASIVQCDLAAQPDPFADIEAILTQINRVVPPMWPLKDYVAVNPFTGLTDERFLDVRQMLCDVRECDMLMSRAYFRNACETAGIGRADIDSARKQCEMEYPEYFSDLTTDAIQDWLSWATTDADNQDTVPRFHTAAHAIDQLTGSSWSCAIVNEIGRHLAAHFDEGQAIWPSPWRHLSLYEAWRQRAQLDHRMSQLGLKALYPLLRDLPADPKQAVVELLENIGVPRAAWRGFTLAQILSIPGWASYVRFKADDYSGELNSAMSGLLAMRLAYDAALATKHKSLMKEQCLWPCDDSDTSEAMLPSLPTQSVLARYVMQVAIEAAYRNRICESLVQMEKPSAASKRKSLQMIFCIDVRSEVFRRHLESLSDDIETMGFAGFFGIAMSHVKLGETEGVAQCPVLLKPGFCVHETVGQSPVAQDQIVQARKTTRLTRKVWKGFQSSAASCFCFVESIGLGYLAKLATDSLGLTRPVASARFDAMSKAARLTLAPDLHHHLDPLLTPERKLALAEGLLRNLGLTSDFARIVALCGHASDVVNNPYQAALDCGACGGHSGEVNARVASALLNDHTIRQGLASRGIHVPHDTLFVAATHNTTSDEITLHDLATTCESHADDLSKLQRWTREAGALTRIERSKRMNQESPHAILRRGLDWSQLRPEWGLAGNAAFVVAPRWRTRGLDLGGRTFLHNYEHAKDPQLNILELIMTAPMIVTSWINLQYYASAVDNRAFGAGNKAIHNVVGQFGVTLGNGGDLTTGLPWQSISDGAKLQHEPLRLLVVVEAPRPAIQTIIEKHAMVRDLVTNGWLTLVSLEEDRTFRWDSQGQWS